MRRRRCWYQKVEQSSWGASVGTDAVGNTQEWQKPLADLFSSSNQAGQRQVRSLGNSANNIPVHFSRAGAQMPPRLILPKAAYSTNIPLLQLPPLTNLECGKGQSRLPITPRHFLREGRVFLVSSMAGPSNTRRWPPPWTGDWTVMMICPPVLNWAHLLHGDQMPLLRSFR